MYILGINFACYGHDLSACLIKDGEIVQFIEEERLRRTKYVYNQSPCKAIEYCLTKEGITLDDIEIIANGWDCTIVDNMTEDQFIRKIIAKETFNYKKVPKVIFVKHHLAHAASAYRASGWDETGILVIDGNGENESVTLAYGEDKEIKIIDSIDIKDSLGLFYEAIAQYLGFNLQDAGKLMGLASYGKPVYNFDEFVITDNGYKTSLVTKEKNGSLNQYVEVIRQWREILVNKFGESNTQEKCKLNECMNIDIYTTKFNEKQKNIAASAQAKLQEIIVHLVKIIQNKTGKKKLVFSGGVALNCAINGYLMENNIVEDLYVFPVANDAGTSIGAALEVWHGINKKIDNKKITNNTWGNSFTSNSIETLLDSLKIKYKKNDEYYKVAAEMLNEGKIIGWFQGRSEAGPRALGHRSILASPVDIKTRDYINTDIKYRETWRPFAASILFEHYKDVLENATESPFMLLSYKVAEKWRKIAPSILHVDGTTRPQTVRREEDEVYWKLIKSYYDISKIPFILNTSFNLKGKPIVETPQDAITTFYLSGLDALIMEDIIIIK